MSVAARRWTLAVGSTLLIWATLGVVRVPSNWLRDHNLLRLTVGIAFAAALVAALLLLLRHGRPSAARLAAFAGVLLLYPLASLWGATPEERIHLIEYGLLGVLFARALAADPATGRRRVFLLALLLGSAAGLIDELIQGILPNRYGDVRDVIFNAASVLLGLALREVLTAPDPSVSHSSTTGGRLTP
jgi:multisubunit Na+/H+ antiporter MnhG subunit